MHEMALAEGILAVALDVAEGQRVHRVRVLVGELQRVVPDALQFGFELAAQDTAANGAVLELTDVPARVRCRPCGAESEPGGSVLACRRCGAMEVDLLAGDTLLVEAIQLASGWVYAPTGDERAAPRVDAPEDHLAWHARHDPAQTPERGHTAAIEHSDTQLQRRH